MSNQFRILSNLNEISERVTIIESQHVEDLLTKIDAVEEKLGAFDNFAVSQWNGIAALGALATHEVIYATIGASVFLNGIVLDGSKIVVPVQGVYTWLANHTWGISVSGEVHMYLDHYDVNNTLINSGVAYVIGNTTNGNIAAYQHGINLPMMAGDYIIARVYTEIARDYGVAGKTTRFSLKYTGPFAGR